MGTPFREPDSFIQMTPELRRRLEATIEHLVSLMDAIDGDPDIEHDDDQEPDLGWSVTGGFGLSDVSNLDLEVEDYFR